MISPQLFPTTYHILWGTGFMLWGTCLHNIKTSTTYKFTPQRIPTTWSPQRKACYPQHKDLHLAPPQHKAFPHNIKFNPQKHGFGGGFMLWVTCSMLCMYVVHNTGYVVGNKSAYVVGMRCGQKQFMLWGKPFMLWVTPMYMLWRTLMFPTT